MAPLELVIGVSRSTLGAQDEAGGGKLAIIEASVRRQLRTDDPVGPPLMIDQAVGTEFGNRGKRGLCRTAARLVAGMNA